MPLQLIRNAEVAGSLINLREQGEASAKFR